MLWLFVWVAFGILCAVIAPGRGRSAAAWFFLGAIFGLFGLVALLAMPSVKGEGEAEHGTPEPPIAIEDLRTCPHCAEEIKAAAIVCKHCGRDIEQAT